MAVIFKEPMKILNELEEAINSTEARYKYRIHNLEKRVAELENPLIKDKEIIKMKYERDRALEDLNRGFRISKEDEEKIEKWKKNHINNKYCGNALNGVSGGQWTYSFTPTSIGIFGEVTCLCGDTFIFSDI